MRFAIIRGVAPNRIGARLTMPGNDSSAAKRALVPQRGPQPPRFIAIEGPLRVGKSTLARVLAERLHARRIYDCEDNPFLADFYKARSEEHTSELQSLRQLVCRLLLEKKKRRKCSDSLRQLA